MLLFAFQAGLKSGCRSGSPLPLLASEAAPRRCCTTAISFLFHLFMGLSLPCWAVSAQPSLSPAAHPPGGDTARAAGDTGDTAVALVSPAFPFTIPDAPDSEGRVWRWQSASHISHASLHRGGFPWKAEGEVLSAFPPLPGLLHPSLGCQTCLCSVPCLEKS